jgi:dTDP-glucose 4,6-dehydratase|tara:strand:+ start:3094 stop:4128 length:1035 start_codon:yes stop_codon:yes gene_type:complete
MKKILLTGSNGFLGEEIFNELKQDYEFILLDKDDNQFNSSTENSIFYKIDIRDKNQLIKIFQDHKIDIILHCAAELLDEKNSNKVWETNYNGTNNLLDLADEYKVEKFIFTSTFSLFEKNYNTPINEKELPSAIVDYGRSKYAAENLILRHNYSGDIIIFRCPVIIGKKRLDKLAILFEMIRENVTIWMIGDGSNQIHFIYSKDLIEAMKLSFGLKGKHLFNIGSDNIKNLKNTFISLLKHADHKGEIRHMPKMLGIFGLKFLHLFGVISLGPYHQRMLVSNIVLDTQRIKDKLKWEPKFSNDEMLKECYDYYLKTIDEKKHLTASKKLPNLKIIKLLKFFSFS